MQENWKREQDLVIQLESDVQFKEDQLQKAIDANAMQKGMIDMLTADLNHARR